MAAIEQTIPNLLGGVSQQPDPVKLAGQVRVADNVYLDPTFGCMKRPPTEYVGCWEIPSPKVMMSNGSLSSEIRMSVISLVSIEMK